MFVNVYYWVFYVDFGVVEGDGFGDCEDCVRKWDEDIEEEGVGGVCVGDLL